MSNKITDLDIDNLNLYVPGRLIGYDVNKFHNVEDFPEIHNIVDTIQKEFEEKISDPFVKELLMAEREDGVEWDSQQNLRKSAIEHRPSIKCQCMFDIEPQNGRSFVMYSLFS